MSRQGKQVDPFNAGDPTMPWDEADFVPLDAGGWQNPSDAAWATSSTTSRHDECWAEEPSGARTPDEAPTHAQPATRARTKRHSSRSSTARTPRTQDALEASSGGEGRATGSSTAVSWPAPKPATDKLRYDDAPEAYEAAEEASAAQSPKQRRHTLRRRIIIAVLALNAVLIAVGLVGGLIGKLVDLAESAFSSNYEYSFSYEYDSDQGFDWDTYASVTEELEAQQTSQLEAILAGMVTCDEELLTTGTQHINDFFEGTCYCGAYGGLSLSDLGIDAEGLARWTLAGIRYDTSELFSSAGSDDDTDTVYSGTASVSISHPDVEEVLWELDSYLCEEVSYDMDGLAPSKLSNALKTGAQQRLEELKQETEETENYFSIDFTGSCASDGSNPVATIDADSFASEFADIFGIWLD